MKKVIAVILTALFVSGLIFGCSPKVKSPAPDKSAAVTQDSNAQENPKSETPKANTTSDELKQATGTYNGQSDNTFIEIKLDDMEKPLEFSIEEVQDSFKGFEEGNKVKITYIINENKQYILKSIEKSK